MFRPPSWSPSSLVTKVKKMRFAIEISFDIKSLGNCCAQHGRAVAQAVSRRPPTAEARVRYRVSPCGIFGGQSGTGTGFSPSASVFPYQFHSTGAPLLGKGQKKGCTRRLKAAVRP
jgi:hypothetical protein